MNSESGIHPGGVCIDGRAKNIAPLHLMRCMIVGCSGMEMEKNRLRGKNNGYGLQGGNVDVDSSVKLPIWRENLAICLLYLY